MVGCLGEEEKGEMKEYNLCFGLDLQRVCDEFMTLSFPSFYTIYFTKLAHPFSWLKAHALRSKYSKIDKNKK